MPHVFLSYSRVDTEFMRRLRADMQAEGLDVWTDETGMDPGTPAWENAIQTALDSAGCLVVILSPDAKDSLWVTRELSYAEEHGVRIFPILVRGTYKESVPLRLTSTQRVDARENYDEAKEVLILAVCHYLDVEPLSQRRKREAEEEEERRKVREAYRRKKEEEEAFRQAQQAAASTPIDDAHATAQAGKRRTNLVAIGGGAIGLLVVVALALGLGGAFSGPEDGTIATENPQDEIQDSVAADATATPESVAADSESAMPEPTAMPTPMPKSSVVDALVVARDDFDSLYSGSAWYVNPEHQPYFNIESGLLRVGGGETYMSATDSWRIRAGESSAILCKMFLQPDASFHFEMNNNASVAFSENWRNWGIFYWPESEQLVAFTHIGRGNEDNSEFTPYDLEGLTPFVANASYYLMIGTDGDGLLVAQAWLENDPGGRVEWRQDAGSEWVWSEWIPAFSFVEGSAEITIDFCELLYTIPN